MYNLKILRKNANLTQRELAYKVGVHTAAVSKWEKGLTFPSVETLIMLADFFGTSVDFILERSECDRQQIRNENNSFSEKQENLIPLIQMLNDRQCELTQAYLENILDIVTEQQQNWGI